MRAEQAKDSSHICFSLKGRIGVRTDPAAFIFSKIYPIPPSAEKDRGWGAQDPYRGGLPMASRSSRWPYIRKMAWNRDRKTRAKCHICGEDIDYFVPPSSTPDAYEPDHIIPVHLRPDLELDLNNIKASHRRCNRQRGDGQSNASNDVGRHSRIW